MSAAAGGGGHRDGAGGGGWAGGDCGAGRCWQGPQQGCLLSPSDTQYKMTISMADWPSEASEVSWWSGQAPGHPPLG